MKKKKVLSNEILYEVLAFISEIGVLVCLGKLIRFTNVIATPQTNGEEVLLFVLIILLLFATTFFLSKVVKKNSNPSNNNHPKHPTFY